MATKKTRNKHLQERLLLHQRFSATSGPVQPQRLRQVAHSHKRHLRRKNSLCGEDLVQGGRDALHLFFILRKVE